MSCSGWQAEPQASEQLSHMAGREEKEQGACSLNCVSGRSLVNFLCKVYVSKSACTVIREK